MTTGAKVLAGVATLIVVVVALALLVVPAALDAMATSEARVRLEERGILCDERFAVDVSLSMDTAILAPTRCTMAEGPLAAIALGTPLTVELVDREPVMLRAEQVQVELRDEPAPAGGGWGPIMDALAVPARIGALTRGVAELAQRDLPSAALTDVEVLRGAQLFATLHEVQLSAGSPLTLSAAHVALPAVAAPLGARAEMGIDALRATGTGDDVQLEGRLDVDATMPIFGSLSQHRPFTVHARGLEGPSPTWELNL